jgi:hypothetical protein
MSLLAADMSWLTGIIHEAEYAHYILEANDEE